MTLRCIIAAALLLAAVDQAPAQVPQDLRALSLEDLGNIEVTTVSRIPDTVANTPAAVYVITQDDIRRAGARSIPEALRLAPGVQVARIDSSRWAIGVRGFADRLARSILVLIDGRAVYSPLFAGTYWEVQDTLLEDIDRIEVIRGPGGTLWGANAINGIINIVTKPGSDTRGMLVTGQGGTQDYGSVGVRFGRAADKLSYRAYAKIVNRGPAFHAQGEPYDDWRSEQGGFRGDWLLSSGRTMTLQGDVYRARLGQQASMAMFTSPYTQIRTIDSTLSGANILTRWSSPVNARNGFRLQAYYDRTSRDEIPLRESRDTFDLDFQHTWRRWPRQDLVWGLGQRVTSDSITATLPTEFVPGTRTDSLSSAFAYNEIALLPERLRMDFGAKVEHNSYSGFEIQPSARTVWTPTPAQTIVASVARAVRTPSRVETDYTTASFAGLNNALPIFVRLAPNPDFTSESLIAYEAGYRIRPTSYAYVTVSSFYNSLAHILSAELRTPFLEATAPAPPRFILPVTFGNGLEGESHGVEATADVRPTTWWRMTGNYSYLRMSLSKVAGSTDVNAERTYEGRIPSHQWQVRSSIDMPRGWSIDAFLRSISELPGVPVPGYTNSTLRVAWRPTSRLEVAVVGADLHRSHHPEWSAGAGRIEVPRSGYASVIWTW